MQIKFYNSRKVPAVTVSAATVTLVSTAVNPPPPTNPRTVVEIPLQNVAGTIFLYVENVNVTPSGVEMQNYGVPFTSTDKVAVVNCSEGQQLFAYSASANTLYPTEKW